MTQDPDAIISAAYGPPSSGTLGRSRARERALWVGVLAVVLGFAGVLAVTALPARPVSDTESAGVTVASRPARPPAAEREIPANGGPAVKPQMRGPLSPAVSLGDLFGPPERVRTIAEKAIESLMLTAGADSDIAAVKAALADIGGSRYATALARTTAMSNTGAQNLVRWYAYRRFNSGVPAEEIEAFRIANPEWPENELLRRRAEESLFLGNVRPGTIRAFFKNSEPRSVSGNAALTIAELEAGKTDAARKRIRAAWRDGSYGISIENRMLARFKALITEADIKWRLDRNLLNDNRYGRSERLGVIRRMIKYLGPEEAAKAKVRLIIWRSYGRRGRKRRIAAAVRALAALEKIKAATKIALPVRRPKNPASIPGSTEGDTAGKTEEKTTATVEPAVAATPPASPKPDGTTKTATDWPFEYHRIQLLRRQGRHGEAWRRLTQAPTAKNLVVAPEHWWVERRVNAFNALYKKSYRMAYRLVANPGKLEPNARNEASFMAGWIALRFLGDPEAAQRHFEAFTLSADGPRTRAQSHYWLARTFAVFGNAEGAARSYRIAAREFNTYYGQLARQKLDPGLRLLDIPKPPELTPEHIADGAKRDIIQALRFARLAGHGDATRRLLRAIRKSKQPPHVFHLAAEFAKSMGDTQMGVRIGKSALFHGIPLTEYAYPVHAFPTFKPIKTPPESAMLYGLARQESEFNTLITSIAGARGVLQVMQVTARDVCRTYKLRCGSRSTLRRRLNADPSYNARLASAYISDRLEEFTGSYILTYAGYNAGPGRARYWIRKSGDPRNKSVDPIDWVELIHIKETREYIKKVMANLQVYRALLDTPATALQITSDIERGAF